MAGDWLQTKNEKLVLIWERGTRLLSGAEQFIGEDRKWRNSTSKEKARVSAVCEAEQSAGFGRSDLKMGCTWLSKNHDVPECQRLQG